MIHEIFEKVGPGRDGKVDIQVMCCFYNGRRVEEGRGGEELGGDAGLKYVVSETFESAESGEV
eukprot:768702-Hanusia_phi.AAC.3